MESVQNYEKIIIFKNCKTHWTIPVIIYIIHVNKLINAKA